MKMNPRCLYVLALTLTALSITGCSGGSSSSTTPPAIQKQTVEKYPVSGVLKETDGFAMPGTVSLAATDSSGNPVTLYSDKTGGKIITTVTAGDDGLISFFVDSSAALPVTVKAAGTTTVPNHIASSTKFVITKSGTTYFAINIVDLDVPSPGVNPTIVDSMLDVDDILPTPFSMQATSTQVTIPSGTVFRDSANTDLKGAVKASLTAFASSTTTTSVIDDAVFDTTIYNPELEGGTAATLPQSDLENFPGGLNNSHAGAGAGYFVTAGFVAVNVKDASGKQAKKLASGTFTIRMDIPAGTLNPANNDAPVQAGDSIPIFTYDETAMLWKPETVGGVQTTGKVLSDPNGLYVLHTTDHFSFWNLGWLVQTTGAFCPTATITLLNDAIAYPLNLKATFTTSVTLGGKKGKNFLLTGIKPAGDATITVQNVPNNPLNIVFTDATNKVVYSVKGHNLCTTPLTASYTAPLSKKAVPITVNVTEYCEQSPSVSQVVPSTLTTVTKNFPNPGRIPLIAYIPISFGVTDTNGTYIHKLVAGTYNFSAFDRRTATFVPATQPVNPINVVKATPQTVSIKIPVTCKPVISGSTGGTGGYTF